MPMVYSFTLALPSAQGSPANRAFSRAIAIRTPRDRRLSSAPSGTAQRDLINGRNSWMKSIVLERHFLLIFAAVGKSKSFSMDTV
jgi:hypothetical protein